MLIRQSLKSIDAQLDRVEANLSKALEMAAEVKFKLLEAKAHEYLNRR